MLAFYLGGVIATACIVLGEVIDDDKPLELEDMLPVLAWPIGVVMFVIAAIRGRS
ncbi:MULTISPECIES: hypothetical protein [unclassified Sphingomonas]|jgi:hypothetical protein|uniref:hypothetical protein n=1 Tax=unclassified Sphingomonas TaxID=196159 RepID=UPI000A9455C0|nr:MULTISPECIES: hypothetical protein [unclassified Sphingomonas]